MEKAQGIVRDFLRGKNSATADVENFDPNAQFDNEEPSFSGGSEPEMSKIAPGMYKPVPEKMIYEWMALSRPFRKRNRQFFTTVLVIALLISLILFFSGQFLPIAMVFSVVFLNYVLAVVPPPEVSHRITTFGINVEGNLYYWEELGRFWFDTKHDSTLLMIETIRFPGKLILVLPKDKKEVVSEILSEVLLQQKPPLSSFEKIAKWIQEKFPLE